MKLFQARKYLLHSTTKSSLLSYPSFNYQTASKKRVLTDFETELSDYKSKMTVMRK